MPEFQKNTTFHWYADQHDHTLKVVIVQ